MKPNSDIPMFRHKLLTLKSHNMYQDQKYIWSKEARRNALFLCNESLEIKRTHILFSFFFLYKLLETKFDKTQHSVSNMDTVSL